MKAASRIVLALSRKLVGSSAAGGHHFYPSRPATRRTVPYAAATILGIAASFFVIAFSFAGPVRPVERDHDDKLVTMIAANRPFPVVEIQIGDVPVAIPKDWVDSKSKFLTIRKGTQPHIQFVNAHQLPRPRTPYFEVPSLALFGLTEVSSGLAASNLKRRREELEARWEVREPDEHGFWRWKTREYLLTTKAHQRPLEQPLIVDCPTPPQETSSPVLNRCTVRFYWTLSVSVRYEFLKTDVPKSQWVELDRRVLEFLKFLDGRVSLTGRN